MKEENSMDAVIRRDKKKRKKLKLKTEVFLETAERMAPIVGYFPSGYDPTSAASDPDVKVFRNRTKPSCLELIVRPGDCNVEFIGKSYVGEAAVPQLSTYALGVLDKETQTLKIVPIAANKILRLEPKVINGFGDLPEINKESIIDEKKQNRMAELTHLYGTKKAKNMVNKWRSINQKSDDPSALGLLESGMLPDNMNDRATEDVKEPVVRNIPPYDSSAVKPENAYLLHEIIPKGERDYLHDILETIESHPEASYNIKFWEENHYPSFVIHRLPKLRKMQEGEEKRRLACILSYITHLVNFRKVAEPIRWKSNPNYTESMSEYKVPPIVYHKFLMVFLDPISSVLSSEKNELLICHILVLTLFADDFRTYTADIENDLGMTAAALRPFFKQLGCKLHRDGLFKKSYMTLPVPLVFEEFRKRKRR